MNIRQIKDGKETWQVGRSKFANGCKEEEATLFLAEMETKRDGESEDDFRNVMIIGKRK